jgi:aminoglycoside phosphotransferase (APT) family kinase protein
VYALDDDRVLRRYRDGFDVTGEAALMTHVAGFGFPVPRVLDAQGSDLVLERVEGPSLMARLAAGELAIEDAGRTLADLLAHLRDVPARRSRDQAVRMMHLDLHPGNVLIGARGPVVIDWRNAAEGPPALDVAMSAVIIAQAAVVKDPRVATGARAMLEALLRAVDVDPLPALDAAIARRACDKFMTRPETALLPAARRLILEHRRPREDR